MQVGGPSVFEPFFKHFIQKHASTAVDSSQFKSDFLQFFAGNAHIAQIDWEVRATQNHSGLGSDRVDTSPLPSRYRWESRAAHVWSRASLGKLRAYVDGTGR